jgi:hypothetical protein
LRKDVRRRLQDIADARIEIEDARSEPATALTKAPAPVTSVVAKGQKPARLAWTLFLAAAVLVIALALTLFVYLRRQGEPEVVRFLVSVAATPNAGDMAVSPDGRWIAYVGPADAGKWGLFVRRLASVTSQLLLQRTEAVSKPFWSPDSRSIAFLGESNRLERVELSGGPAQMLGATGSISFSGGTWNSEGTIVYAPGVTRGNVLYRSSAAGGEDMAVTALDSSQRETAHLWPFFLPDGRHFLYLAWSTQISNRAVWVGSLDSKEKKRLLATESMAVYADPGYLIFRRGGTLFAQQFDAGKLALSGDPERIADEIAAGDNGLGAFSVSRNGVLAYRSGGGPAASRRFAWLDRAGRQLWSGEPALFTNNFDLSPDGKQIAVGRSTRRRPNMTSGRSIGLEASPHR